MSEEVEAAEATETLETDQVEGAEPEQVEIKKEFLESIAVKYADIHEYCEDADHFANVVHEIAMFEIVTSQINQIFTDTLYVKEVDTLSGAAVETVDLIKSNFAVKFVQDTKEAGKLSSLPTLDLIVSWITEVHENIAAQLFTEDFAKEILAPAYTNIAEAIIEVSVGAERESERESEGEPEEEG